MENKKYTQISNGILASEELPDVYEIQLEHGLPISIQHWPTSPTDSLDRRNSSYKQGQSGEARQVLIPKLPLSPDIGAQLLFKMSAGLLERELATSITVGSPISLIRGVLSSLRDDQLLKTFNNVFVNVGCTKM